MLLLILSSPTLINSPPFYYNISQNSSINLKQIVRHQQEWIATLQTLIAQAGIEKEVIIASRPNTGSNIEVTKLKTFNRETGKVLGL